jgi:hypothetical protein
VLSIIGLQTISIWPGHRRSLFVSLLFFWAWQHFLLDGLEVKTNIMTNRYDLLRPLSLGHSLLEQWQPSSDFKFLTFLFRKAFCRSIRWLFCIFVSSCWTSIDCKFHHINFIQVLTVIFILYFFILQNGFNFSHLFFYFLSSRTCVPAGPAVTTHSSLFTTSTACLCLWCPCRLWKECQVCHLFSVVLLSFVHGFLILLSFIFYYNLWYPYVGSLH